MKTGVGFPSYADQAVWTAQTGSWDANYPPTALGDLVRPSQVARSPADPYASAQAVLPASVPIQMVALVNHDIPAGSSFLVQAYSTANPDGSATGLIYDSGVLPVWPSGGPVAGVQAVRPLILPAPLVARSIRLVVFAPGQVVNIGAVEISGFWEWPGVSYGRENGFRTRDVREKAVGGASRGSKRKDPRVIRGQIDLLRMSVTQTQGLDFQKRLDIQRPFVWMQDYDDPSTWARLCMLVRNEQVSPMVGRLYRHDAFPINLVEHMR